MREGEKESRRVSEREGDSERAREGESRRVREGEGESKKGRGEGGESTVTLQQLWLQ